MNIKYALNETIKRLKEKNIQNPMLKARILLCNVLKMRKEDLIIHDDMEIEKSAIERYFESINKLCQNIPLQYITGEQEFMGDIFKVNEYVLIPRCDTEILVETALKYTKNNVLELCTGSGVIAVSIAKRAKVNISAVDISDNALKVAKENAKMHHVEVNFIKSNMFEKVTGKYDLIVANPPYIETETISKLDEEVKNEPVIALDGGKDGLDFYRIIEQNAEKFLNANGYICLEIGYNQREKVEEIFKKRYSSVHCIKDLSGNDRVVVISK